MSSDNEEHPAIRFIRALFGDATTKAVYCCSLPNEKGTAAVGERSIADRDITNITAFVNRWSREGRGVYVCAGTLEAGSRRNKANIIETPAAFTDIDYKSVEQSSEALALPCVQGARLRPSCIVRSGHGLHAWWFLKEAVATQDNIERIETVLHQLADIFGGDHEVSHVAALMRLPGTDNTKGGNRIPVEIIELNDLRYELDDLEEWLAEQSPLLRRKERPKPPATNPYLAIAARMEFKAPVDIEQRLAAMTYQGAGDSAIHATQRAVSASLVSRGVPVDQIVTTLLDATRAAAGDSGARWNWRVEERNVRRMCTSWAEKIETAEGSRREGVVELAQARAERAKPAPVSVDKAKKFHAIAEQVINALKAHDKALLFDDNGMAWFYSEGLWTLRDDYRHVLNTLLERACRVLGIASNVRLINEARAFIERDPDLSVENLLWDQHGKVPTMSGLVDPDTLELDQAQPEHRVTWRVTCEWKPDATCPLWLRMLADAYADRSASERAEVIRALQECLGSALLDRKPRGLRKALVLVGGKWSGKSELLQVMSGIFGDACIGQGIETVGGTHGLMPFLRRLPWVLDEAFSQNIWHLSATVKTIITGDRISVNVKNGPIISTHFTGPIFWGSNHPPQFKESTRAIVDRLLVIECKQHFNAASPVGVAATAEREHFSGPAALVLAREKCGVLAWALEGLRRALKRNHIAMPTESVEVAERIFRDANLVAGFVEECVELSADSRVSIPDVCLAVTTWFLENKGENRNLPSNDAIGKALVALHDPKIVSDRYELRDNATRYVVGIRLNTLGLQYHQRGITANLFEGKTVQATLGGGTINQMIPASWERKKRVCAMRAAHAQHAKLAEMKCHSEVTDESVNDASSNADVSPSQPSGKSRDPLF
jgi:hypothetical protein